MLEKLKSRARTLQADVRTLVVAFQDPRTPWAARGMIALVAAYALSPIDLIPDFIPVLGYLDDLILIPAGIALAIRMIPSQVMADSHKAAQHDGSVKSLGMLGAGIIVLIWILAIIVLASLIYRSLEEKL